VSVLPGLRGCDYETPLARWMRNARHEWVLRITESDFGRAPRPSRASRLKRGASPLAIAASARLARPWGSDGGSDA
jgi:hypothetical protein